MGPKRDFKESATGRNNTNMHIHSRAAHFLRDTTAHHADARSVLDERAIVAT